MQKTLADKRFGVTVFYPYEDLFRRVGKKIRKFSKPYISNFMFFKASEPVTCELEPEIKEYGRIIKGPERRSSAYAVVPPAEMDRFRKAVGCFSDDCQVEVEDFPALRKGDKIGITGFDAVRPYEIDSVIDGKTGEKKVTLRLVVRDTDPSGAPREYAIVLTTHLSRIHKL